ncbi:hypothetical protein DM39_4255 [Burkholderia cenocepacia]|uniref:Uncharacterized protein n=1 Tax=Burkholderia cenocepacia TaxID=95486 RepID=A0AAN0RXA6_9BURK|nr:hypothetical protein DM39_4255 [Burkholderia cenocepacia]
MDIIELAIASGLQVTLDGRIGTQEYSSVHGSLQALRRFADAVAITVPFVAGREMPTQGESQSDSLNTQACKARNAC